jgi:hypothetical protein
MIGCSHPAKQFAAQDAASVMMTPAPAPPPPEGNLPPNAVQRYIAVRHKLVIEAPGARLQKAWESAGALCRSIRCEIKSSSFTIGTPDSPSEGSISVRVDPQDLPKLMGQLGKAGIIVQHSTKSEDKTATVIDVEA